MKVEEIIVILICQESLSFVHCMCIKKAVS